MPATKNPDFRVMVSGLLQPLDSHCNRMTARFFLRNHIVHRHRALSHPVPLAHIVTQLLGITSLFRG
jgi:hypothetical protein